jgi:NH3-dependent NAD+ synthetase
MIIDVDDSSAVLGISGGIEWVIVLVVVSELGDGMVRASRETSGVRRGGMVVG